MNSAKAHITGLLLSLFLIVSACQPSLSMGSPDDPLSVAYLYSRECLSCQQAWPGVKKALDSAPMPVDLVRYDLDTEAGREYARAHGIGSVPAIVVDGGPALLYEDYGDVGAFEGALRQRLDEAARHTPPVTLSRRVTRDAPAPGLITVDTCISCRAKAPVQVSLAGGTSPGMVVVSGKTTWQGALMPGESRHVLYTVQLPQGMKAIPPQIISYDEGIGARTIVGQETPVLIAELSALAVFVAGLIAGVNPCLIAVMAFLAGTTLSATGKRIRLLARILSFCGGLLAVYLLIGIGMLEVIGRSPSLGLALRGTFAAALFAFAAWSFYDAYRTEKGVESRTFKKVLGWMRPLYDRFSLPASFAMGAAFGLVKMPCVGGMYLAILGMIVTAGEAARGVAYLTIYNLGVVVPAVALGGLMVIGLSPSAVNELRLRHRVTLKIATGALLAVMAFGFALGAL